MDFIEVGIISEVKDDGARVSIGSMVTDFLPVTQIANSFTRSFEPIRVGEQVVVLPIRGSLNSGVILRSIYQTSHDAPGVDTKEQLIVYEDGVKMSYNTGSSTLTISSPKQILIECENATLNATNVNVNALNTVVKSTDISLIGQTSITGDISTTGAGGGGGSFNIKGNMNINGNVVVSGNISDARGDLTGHSHSDSDGGTSLPR
ncbi:phage baseplate assembly protein V [Campylobacter pinnipediorum subsp. caledonicus]|uniref:phage baseplate assembly protein V n=1 Tax=Campylobacter pinnipediorum TaxID=1965231 RepID=UPI0009C1E7A1|nr:phage baseplate assembly protein V [Campylobacter pinnipediorum]AQW85485.1 phage baseplate assembly protein V [Campylobacter pinnipediorum subsp. caledonicus]